VDGRENAASAFPDGDTGAAFLYLAEAVRFGV